MAAYVSRINQIDAAQLDHEIYKILKSQTEEICKLCPQEKVEEWQPEIDAMLKIAIWSFSLASGKSTFGQRLLELKYAKLTRRKAVLFLILDIVPNYVLQRTHSARRFMSAEGNERLVNFSKSLVNIYHFLSFFNLLIFLHRGTQPSVVERILDVESTNSAKHRPRQIGYSYMTRELLWHGLMELFSIGLPMINFPLLKQTIVRFWSKKGENTESKRHETIPHMDKHTRCPYCNENPILPRHAECEHIYCYYCIKSHFAAMDSFPCLACGTQLNSENTQAYLPGKFIPKTDLQKIDS